MKRLFFIFALAVIPFFVHAQHYLGFHVDGASAWQIDQLDETRCGLGGAGQFGFTYEFQLNRFVFNTGIAATYMTTSQILDSVHVSFALKDTRGVPVNYVGIIEDRHDWVNQWHLKIPIMAGLQEGNFYGLVGFVVDYSFRGTTRQQARMTTYGDYDDRYYDFLEEMPNHGYVDRQPIRSNGTVKFLPDLRISAELGGAFLIGNRPRAPKIKVGLFFEYGLIDINYQELNGTLYKYNTTEYLTVDMAHIFTTKNVYGSKINNLEVGLRASFLFNVGGQGTNKGCNCHRRLL